MRKTLIISIVAAAFLALPVSKAQAGWFGAEFGTKPSLTLFGQKLTVPIPSLTLGAAAGTSVSASASSDKGAQLALPFVKLGVKSPTLSVGTKTNKVSVSTAGVKKTK
jgi:hypothetical protein